LIHGVDTKLTDLATATSFDAASWFLLVDPTVTTMDASGTDLKIQAGDLIKGLLPSQAGNSGKVLSTNGTGTLSWIVAAGGGGSGTVTTVSVASANGFGGTVANPTTTPAITITTSITGILKGNGTAISAAAAGTDYEPPITAGTTAQYLKGDKSLGTLNQAAVAGLTTASSPAFAGLTVGSLSGLLKAASGVVSAATAGTDYLTTSYAGTSSIVTVGTITSGTWTGTTIAVANGGTGQTTAANAINALLPTQTSHSGQFLTTNGTVASWGSPAGAGTVTTVSVASANGLAGTVANPTSTPAITLSTTVTGIVKGDGTSLSAATAGTDYATLLTPTAVKTTAYSAAAGDFVPCDSTSAGFAVTLPTAPADKTLIGVKHVIQGGTNSVTVITGGSDVFNKAGTTTLNLTSSSRGVVVQYKASTAIWYVISRDVGAILYADLPSGAANLVVATPDGSSSTPSLRSLVAADIPTLAASKVTAPGSTGQLVYNSSNALTGATNFAIGSSGQLAGTAISDPGSPGAGDLWYSSARPAWTIMRAGNPARLGGTIWQMTGPATAIANTTTETSLLAGGSSIGSLTIPANSLSVGDILRFSFGATWGVTVSQPTCTVSLYLGATRFAGGTATPSATATTGGQLFDIYRLEYQIQAIGASGKIIGSGCLFATKASASSAQIFMPSTTTPATGGGSAAPVQVTIDTTTSLTFDAKYQWGAANASNTVQALTAHLWIVG
jgi:hypothetical protein